MFYTCIFINNTLYVHGCIHVTKPGGIAIIVLAIIVVRLLISKKGKQLCKPSNLAIVGMVFVVFGIIFINLGCIPSYSFFEAAVLLSIIDIIGKQKNK